MSLGEVFMGYWGVFSVALLLGMSISAIAAYLMFRLMNQQTNARLMRLERELAIIRTNEDHKQQRLNEIFLAITGMHKSTEERLSGIHEKIDQYFAIQRVH